MQKLFCTVGLHKYKTVNMTDSFNTTYKDRPNWAPIKHMVWYQQCVCCGKRRMKDTVKKDSIYNARHNGVEYARTAWEERGQMYLGDGVWKQEPPPVAKPNVIAFDVIRGGKE